MADSKKSFRRSPKSLFEKMNNCDIGKKSKKRRTLYDSSVFVPCKPSVINDARSLSIETIQSIDPNLSASFNNTTKNLAIIDQHAFGTPPMKVYKKQRLFSAQRFTASSNRSKIDVAAEDFPNNNIEDELISNRSIVSNISTKESEPSEQKLPSLPHNVETIIKTTPNQLVDQRTSVVFVKEDFQQPSVIKTSDTLHSQCSDANLPAAEKLDNAIPKARNSVGTNSPKVHSNTIAIEVPSEILPFNSSLISKVFSKICKRNRVFAVQQNIVRTTSADSCVARTNGTEQSKKFIWKNIIFDINENYFYYWLAIVSTAYVYNLLVVIARTVFNELTEGYLLLLWLALDLCMDFIYLTDMIVRGRTGFLEQGLLIRDVKKIFSLYLKSYQFKIDVASVLPFDYFMLIVLRKNSPYLRFNRLLRRERIQKFMEQTETRSSLPNAFRVGVVVWYIAIIIHWNACFYFMISESIGLGSDGWVYGKSNGQSLPVNVSDTLTRRYIYSFYWSTLILTTIGEVPGPQKNIEFAFVTIDLMCGVLIFATIVGNVGSMISNMSAARTEFQIRIDNIKQYMKLRKVGKQLEVRVIKWFDYLWANKQNLADQQVLKVLPDKLQAEIAMHVHFETLRKVKIFQDCESGFLAELVLKLQLQVFSPMDYVCRKGDIGREMYIVKRGMLQVVADDGNKVFATLSEGAVFGELSILNIAGSKNGNRRTANVRSVGYTDLFVLNKNDLWIALREYPETKNILIQKGRELLKKDNLLDENVPEENKTAEEIVDELYSSIRILQTRIARLIGEYTNTETKLRDRISNLEIKLRKYGTTLKKVCLMSENESEESDEVSESQKLIKQKHKKPFLKHIKLETSNNLLGV